VSKKKATEMWLFLVAKTDKLSNFKFIYDLSKVADYMDNIDIF